LIFSSFLPFQNMWDTSSFKLVFISSSFANNVWFFSCCLNSLGLFFLYLSVYSMVFFLILSYLGFIDLKIGKKFGSFWVYYFLVSNLGGLPPRVMFFLKLLVLKFFVLSFFPMEFVVILIFVACYFLFFYFGSIVNEIIFSSSKSQFFFRESSFYWWGVFLIYLFLLLFFVKLNLWGYFDGVVF